jgi:sarcosine oxidase
MGAATAWALGGRALVLEQFEVGHDRGSSHGTVRIFRLAYAQPEFVRLGQRALELWRTLERESGTELLSLSGLLQTGGDLDAHRRALTECGAPFEAASAASFGPWRFEPEEDVLLQPDAGVVYAERAQAVFLRGAEVIERTRVERIGEDGRLETTAGPIDAQAVVVTAGAWARRLLAPLGIELPVKETRETVAYFRLDVEHVPSVIDWGAGPYQVYGLGAGEGELKVGLHMSGPVADPDEVGRPDEETVHYLAEWVARRCPAADPEPIRAETCFYTTTPDQRFVLERHGRVVVGSACSGHGFKFAPAIGETLAGLAEEAAVRSGRL